MLFSCVLAYFLPFELFLFSYAVLGPLHYLTEIIWLHKKEYFSKTRYDFLILGALAVLIYFLGYHSHFETPRQHMMWSSSVVYLAFMFAFAFALFSKILHRFLFILGACLLLLIIDRKVPDPNSFIRLFGLFLPTLIHVFVFTGMFILVGALKSKSVTGIASLIVFLSCGASFFVFIPNVSYQASEYVKNSYQGFYMINIELSRILGLTEIKTIPEVYSSPYSIAIARFVSFAYTYHYLNWFSKTSVIKWHKVPKLQLFTVVGIWIIALITYGINYNIGLQALYALSFLHVFLEFPLNHQSFIQAGNLIFRNKITTSV
ncbi:MAG: hypothetical protein NZ455_10770 [Bacteroidia bacterium]|nr:hypothetical protein [Bacteroidia bacterium]MDW8347599.1 hypothetical protein [Bacteroidia bacterium]